MPASLLPASPQGLKSLAQLHAASVLFAQAVERCLPGRSCPGCTVGSSQLGHRVHAIPGREMSDSSLSSSTPSRPFAKLMGTLLDGEERNCARALHLRNRLDNG